MNWETKPLLNDLYDGEWTTDEGIDPEMVKKIAKKHAEIINRQVSDMISGTWNGSQWDDEFQMETSQILEAEMKEQQRLREENRQRRVIYEVAAIF